MNLRDGKDKLVLAYQAVIQCYWERLEVELFRTWRNNADLISSIYEKMQAIGIVKNEERLQLLTLVPGLDVSRDFLSLVEA